MIRRPPRPTLFPYPPLFRSFARAALELISGACEAPLRFLQARLAADFRHKPGLTRFLPAALSGAYDAAVVNPVKWQGSGDVVADRKSTRLNSSHVRISYAVF